MCQTVENYTTQKTGAQIIVLDSKLIQIILIML